MLLSIHKSKADKKHYQKLEENMKDAQIISDNSSHFNENERAEELAAKVNYLFDTFKKQDGKKYQKTEVEAATNGRIDQPWLSKIAKARISRPDLQTLEALTDFFQVDVSFWFKSLEDWKSQLEKEKQLEKEAEENAQQIATMAHRLPPDSQKVVLDLMNSLEERLMSAPPSERVRNFKERHK